MFKMQILDFGVWYFSFFFFHTTFLQWMFSTQWHLTQRWFKNSIMDLKKNNVSVLIPVQHENLLQIKFHSFGKISSKVKDIFSLNCIFNKMWWFEIALNMSKSMGKQKWVFKPIFHRFFMHNSCPSNQLLFFM